MNITQTDHRRIGQGALLVALILAFPAFGAESKQAAEPKQMDSDEQLKGKEMDGTKPAVASPDTKKRQQGYDAEVRHCQSQGGEAKQECIENAKMKYGEMLK